MDRQRTREPPTLIVQAASAAVAGACGAAIAAAGCYTLVYGIASQLYSLTGGTVGTVNGMAGATIAVLFFLVLALAMSVGGGALLSKALGTSTWQRSTLISAVAHAIGIPLWIVAWNYLTSYPELHDVFGEQPLRSYFAAMYAFVVPLVVVFSCYRGDALGGLAVAIFLAVTTAVLPVASMLVDSEELAFTSAVVAWVVLPAISVLGSAIIGPRGN
jgi:hypothetical protein